MCDKFEKPLWVELLPPPGPDSDAFDEELYHEYWGGLLWRRRTLQRFWSSFLGPPAEHVLASVVIQLFWRGVMMGVWHAWCFLLVGCLLFVRLGGWKGWRCVVSWIFGGLRVVG